jgi:hypothetical protein
MFFPFKLAFRKAPANTERSFSGTHCNCLYLATSTLRQRNLSVAFFDVAFTHGLGNHGIGQT